MNDDDQDEKDDQTADDAGLNPVPDLTDPETLEEKAKDEFKKEVGSGDEDDS